MLHFALPLKNTQGVPLLSYLSIGSSLKLHPSFFEIKGLNHFRGPSATACSLIGRNLCSLFNCDATER